VDQAGLGLTLFLPLLLELLNFGGDEVPLNLPKSFESGRIKASVKNGSFSCT
jgi:hypothetical protein